MSDGIYMPLVYPTAEQIIGLTDASIYLYIGLTLWGGLATWVRGLTWARSSRARCRPQRLFAATSEFGAAP